MTLEVVDAEQSDLPAAARLFGEILRELPYYNALAKESEARKYTTATLSRKISEDPHSVLVAKDTDGEMVGFSFNQLDDFTIWIDWLGVGSASRNSGVGAAMLGETIRTAPERRAHKVWCDTRSINEPSKNLLI